MSSTAYRNTSSSDLFNLGLPSDGPAVDGLSCIFPKSEERFEMLLVVGLGCGGPTPLRLSALYDGKETI